MNFDEYQDRCKTTDLIPPSFHPEGIIGIQRIGLIEYRTLCICGEAGELANKVKKIRRDDGNILTDEKRNDIIHELGDIMWYIAILCDIINVSMSEVALKNVDMLAKRKEEGTITGSGENRNGNFKG